MGGTNRRRRVVYSFVVFFTVLTMCLVSERQRWGRMKWAFSRIEVHANDDDGHLRILSEVVLTDNAIESSMHEVEFHGVECKVSVMIRRPHGESYCADVSSEDFFAEITAGPPEFSSPKQAHLRFDVRPLQTDGLYQSLRDGGLVCAVCEVQASTRLFRVGPVVATRHSFVAPLNEGSSDQIQLQLRLDASPSMQLRKSEGENLPHGAAVDLPLRLEFVLPWSFRVEKFFADTEVHMNAGLTYLEETGAIEVATSAVGLVRHWNYTSIMGPDRLVVAVPVTVSKSFDLQNTSVLLKDLLSMEYTIEEDCKTYYAKLRQQHAAGFSMEAPRSLGLRAKNQGSALSRILGDRHTIGWCSEPNSPFATKLSENFSVWEAVESLDQFRRRLGGETKASVRRLALCSATENLAGGAITYDSTNNKSITCAEAAKSGATNAMWSKTCCLPKGLQKKLCSDPACKWPSFPNEADMLLVFAESMVMDNMMMGGVEGVLKSGNSSDGKPITEVMLKGGMFFNGLFNSRGVELTSLSTAVKFAMEDGLFGKVTFDIREVFTQLMVKNQLGQFATASPVIRTLFETLNRNGIKAHVFGNLDFPGYGAKVKAELVQADEDFLSSSVAKAKKGMSATVDIDVDLYDGKTVEGGRAYVTGVLKNLEVEGNFFEAEVKFDIKRSSVSAERLLMSCYIKVVEVEKGQKKELFGFDGLEFEFSDPGKINLPEFYLFLKTNKNDVNALQVQALSEMGKKSGADVLDIEMWVQEKGKKLIEMIGTMTPRLGASNLIMDARKTAMYSLDVAPFKAIERGQALSDNFLVVPRVKDRRLAWKAPPNFQGFDIGFMSVKENGTEIMKVTEGATYALNGRHSLALPDVSVGGKKSEKMSIYGDWHEDGTFGVFGKLGDMEMRVNGKESDVSGKDVGMSRVEVGVFFGKKSGPIIIEMLGAPQGSLTATQGQGASGEHVRIFLDGKLFLNEKTGYCYGDCTKGEFSSFDMTFGNSTIKQAMLAKDGETQVQFSMDSGDGRPLTMEMSSQNKGGVVTMAVSSTVAESHIEVAAVAQNNADKASYSVEFKSKDKNIMKTIALTNGFVDNSKADEVTYNMFLKLEDKTFLTTQGSMMKKASIISGPLTILVDPTGMNEKFTFHQIRVTDGFFKFKKDGKDIDQNHERMYYYVLFKDRAGVKMSMEGMLRRHDIQHYFTGFSMGSVTKVTDIYAATSKASIEGSCELDLVAELTDSNGKPLKSIALLKQALMSMAKKALKKKLGLPDENWIMVAIKEDASRRLDAASASHFKGKVTYRVNIPMSADKKFTKDSVTQSLKSGVGDAITTQTKSEITVTKATVTKEEAAREVQPVAADAVITPSATGNLPPVPAPGAPPPPEAAVLSPKANDDGVNFGGEEFNPQNKEQFNVAALMERTPDKTAANPAGTPDKTAANPAANPVFARKATPSSTASLCSIWVAVAIACFSIA